MNVYLCEIKVQIHLHLDGIESSHVHLEESVLPVISRDAGIVDTSRDVLEWFPILSEAVVLIVDGK